jgi:hypothetical protein
MPLFRLVFPLYGFSKSVEQTAFRIASGRISDVSFDCQQLYPTKSLRIGYAGRFRTFNGRSWLSLRYWNTGETARQARMPVNRWILQSLKEQPRIKLLPKSLLPALRLTYGRMCI